MRISFKVHGTKPCEVLDPLFDILSTWREKIPADMLIQWISFKAHRTKECDGRVLVVEHVLPINDPNTCNGKYSNNVAFFQFSFLIYFPGGNVGDYSKWFIAKSIKCRVPLSEPLSLVCARCNPCHDDDDDCDDDDEDRL